MSHGGRPSPTTASRRLEPAEILALDGGGADALIDRLEAEVPVAPTLLDLPGAPLREAVVFGDTHGDWRSTLAVARRFLEAPLERCLVGLGDYVDRAPADCGEGSVANALYLLQLVAEFPDRVFLLQGNHETVRRISVLPHDLPEEVDQLWGPAIERYARLVGLLERGPLAASSTSGAYLAHAGFPRGSRAGKWRSRFDSVDEDQLIDLVWTECAVSRSRRGISTPFDERDLVRFLEVAGLQVMLRGHDPDIAGRSVYHDRCLTLHTTRLYERFGGVIFAHLPLDQAVHSTSDLAIEHAETEGREFTPPK